MAFAAGFGRPPALSGAAGTAGAVPEVAAPPADAVSSLRFSPVAQLLAATSWDSKLGCWEVSAAGQTAPKAAFSADQPLLCSAWSADGRSIFAGGCSGEGLMWDLQSSQGRAIAKHEAPIRHMQFLPQLSLLVTGSWDCTVAYWDARTAEPALRVQLPERVYAMHSASSTLVVGTAARHVQVFDLRSPGQPAAGGWSRLPHQISCLAAMPDGQGWVQGSTHGRASIHVLGAAGEQQEYTFKCHRTPDSKVRSVNAMAFHPNRPGILATVGSDGGMSLWNLLTKSKTKQFTVSAQPQPLTAVTFSADGAWLAYAASYDWSRGVAGHESNSPTISLHQMVEADFQPKPKTVFGQQQASQRR